MFCSCCSRWSWWSAAVTLAVVGGGRVPSCRGAPERLDDPLPADRPLDRADVEALRLPMALPGYRMADVDDALGRLGAELAERDARIAELESALAARGRRRARPGPARRTGLPRSGPPWEPPQPGPERTVGRRPAGLRRAVRRARPGPADRVAAMSGPASAAAGRPAALLLGLYRPWRLPRLPRHGVGPPGPRRRRALRTALPGGVPVRTVLADDPAPPGGVPRRLRRLQDPGGRRVHRRRRAAAARRRRASSATARRSTRRSPTPGCWPSWPPASWTR